jgi:Ran GTPase-activating protein 1
MAAWAAAFAAHRGVKEVKMTQNGIRPEGIEALLRNGLKHATGLQVIDLQDNTFTLRGATALADVVPGWHHLIDLGVGDCLLKKRGSILLFKALQKGSTSNLQTLRLSFNDIDVTGLNELKQTITGFLPKLRRIELNGNRFSESEPSVEDIRELLLDRLKELGEGKDLGPVMDELEDMEEDESESEVESGVEEPQEVEEEAERVVKDDEEAEEEEIAGEKDEGVDELAKQLGQTTI